MSKHSNRVLFKGILTYVDLPSERAPSGSRGRRVILTRVAAEAALTSIVGMAIDFSTGWDGHDARRKCGIITHAEIVAGVIEIQGYIFGLHFPEVATWIKKNSEKAGMSYEVRNAQVKDMRKQVWELLKVEFVGASILLREKAAYNETSIELEAAE